MSNKRKESHSIYRLAFLRFRRNRLAVIGVMIIVFLILFAIIGPVLTRYSYYEQNLDNAFQTPSSRSLLGTDQLGRDLLTRTMYGARISLAVGIVASLISLIIGVAYGGISGYLGGKVDMIMMRFVDILYGIPLTLFVIVLMVLFKPGLTNIFIALGVVYWLNMARIVRGQVLSLKERDYVSAVKSLGASDIRIIFLHIIPNLIGPVIVTLTFNIPEAIFTESFLSYIGLGVSAPMASWGSLAAEGTIAIRTAPHLLFFPALGISVTMLAFNFVGDGLRDAFDPRMIES